MTCSLEVEKAQDSAPLTAASEMASRTCGAPCKQWVYMGDMVLDGAVVGCWAHMSCELKLEVAGCVLVVVVAWLVVGDWWSK